MKEIEITENDNIVQKIDKCKEEGKQYLDQFKDAFSEAERFYDGVHFRDRDPSRRPKNIIFQLVESEIPLLIDPMPSTDVITEDDEQQPQADVLQAAKDYIYRENDLFIKDVVAIRSMLKVGQGYQYVDFDPDGENGEGSVCVKNLSWNQVILDPSATDLDNCRYAIITVPLSNEELKKRYPKTAQEALNQPIQDVYKFESSKYYDEDQNNGSYGSRYDRNRFKNLTHVEECWIKDYSLIDIPDDETQIQLTEESAQLMQGINPDISKWEDHEAHREGHLEQKFIIASEMLQIPPEEITEQDIEALKESDEQASLLFTIIDDHIAMHDMYIESLDADEVGKKPKYKNFMRLVVKTGQVVHYDDAPEVDDGMIPLVVFWCYKDGRIYADGIVKNIIPMQKTFNEIEEKEVKALKLSVNSGWIVDAQAEVDADTLTDEEGLVVVKEQGTEVQRIQGVNVSPQLSQRAAKEYEFAQRIEGVGEAVLGEAPKHEMSGVSLRRLQQQSLGRIRLKSKMVENAIMRRDHLICTRVIKYWSSERKLRVENANGKYSYVQFDPNAIRDLPYDLILSPGSAAGMDSETIYETYRELLAGQQIDLKTFLEVTNLPKKQIILDKLQANDEQAAMIEQLQQENLMMKAQFAPETLTEEELQIIQQMQSQ